MPSVALRKVSLENIRALIEIAFFEDESLLSDLHIHPGGVDECVDNTLGMIMENAAFYKDDISYHSIDVDGYPRGYTVTIKNSKQPNELYSFGININYRTPEIKAEWLKCVKELLGDYYIVLWAKNKRAIRFFEKNGLVILKNSLYLNDESKTLLLCQQGD